MRPRVGDTIKILETSRSAERPYILCLPELNGRYGIIKEVMERYGFKLGVQISDKNSFYYFYEQVAYFLNIEE